MGSTYNGRQVADIARRDWQSGLERGGGKTEAAHTKGGKRGFFLLGRGLSGETVGPVLRRHWSPLRGALLVVILAAGFSKVGLRSGGKGTGLRLAAEKR